MKRPIFLLLLNLILVPNIFSQIETEFREAFLEAESFFLFEEYADAMPYYQSLNKQYPDNDNINYKIGVCYLNNPYEKEQAITFLEKAVQNVSLKYKENNFRETKAPLEAYFYLGNAYRINNQIDRAIETYRSFHEQADPELYDLDLVDEQIKACQNAKDLETKPIDIEILNLGDRINTRFSDVHPVVSGDETKMVFIQKQPFYDAPFFSEKVDGEWSFPRNLIEEFGVDQDAYPVALSYTGDELLVYRSDNFIGDLYTSRYVDGLWTPLAKLNANINTKYWESHGCFTTSGDTMYFTSNRKDGFGGLDIYLSVRGEDGEWGLPVNLGPTINTKYNEETPFITDDSRTLYFSSYGHHNMGGYDVFYATRLEDGEWSVPINAGYPINTTDDDVFFLPVQNGAYAYFPRFRDDTYGRTDIYLLEVFSETHPRKFQVNGILGLEDLESLTRPIRVAVIEQFSGDTIAIAIADPETGEFTFVATAGQYDLLVEGEDIETTTSVFVIPEGYRQKEMDLTKAILLTQAKRLEDLMPIIADDIQVEDTLILVDTDEAIEIPMTLERNARLFVDVLHDTLFTGRDSFNIEKRKFIYSYVPVPGSNLLKFKMIDRRGSLSFKDIHVIYTPKAVLVEEIPQEKTPEEVIVPEETLAFQAGLAALSTGALKELLDNLDLAAEGIDSEEELLIYLREHADEYNYDSQDVYDLILKKMQVEYMQDYLDELTKITSDENLRRALEEIDIAGENISTLQGLYENLLSKSETYGYEAEDVNELFSLLSQREELNELISELSDIAEGDLKTLLENLDTEAEGINNPVELMSYLIREAENYDYTQEDAMALLLDYLETEDLKEVVQLLIGTSSGDLQTVLINLNLEQQNIRNLNDLYNYLMAQAQYYDYTEADVMKLFLNLLRIMEDKPLVESIEPPAISEDEEKRGGRWIYYLLGGILLIIIFIFLRRRKESDKKET